ncbi:MULTISPECIES: FkbM family methyltransferase [Cyanobium]|uniref:Methyltransferase FkbM domain-containing protein n=1 Tax=Cyanobium usitatum str. Tous TaxID=2116684 RepID=A0A2P7MVA8_9CYAN|nr:MULTISPECIES: FkbM family methyltransferase [Cyanobium]MCP9780695.1 FkbM family methyltransferase [Cyanobium sp. To12R1]PSJ05122.1 hypothetical protein C7K55_07135 [Cyanobium usitatum str. Tous]
MWTPQRFYAQNFEDLYLYRLFSGIDKGFYVDVGAWHPRRDNVTAIFYDQGWRGINIEPVAEVFDILSSERVQDVNLCLAVVDDIGADAVPLLVSGDDPTMWGHHRLLSEAVFGSQASFDRHSHSSSKRYVPSSTLREIIERYASNRPINFLKLDVEGWEYKALLGLDVKSLPEHQRPQVILLEATVPQTRLSASHRKPCRDYLLDCSYEYFFHDGLNDYYCDAGLRLVYESMMLPPNIFDIPMIPIGYRLFEGLAQQKKDLAALAEARKEAAQALRALDEFKQQLAAQDHVIEQLHAELEQRSADPPNAEAVLRQVSGKLRQLLQR